MKPANNGFYRFFLVGLLEDCDGDVFSTVKAPGLHQAPVNLVKTVVAQLQVHFVRETLLSAFGPL